MKAKESNQELIFEGRIVRCVWDSEKYKAYAIDVDREKFPFIKYTKFGNAIISGDLHSLGEGIVYKVNAVEELTKNGYGYKVINIKRDRPNSLLDMQIFLAEILTPVQAKVLYEAYPDIVDRVVNNKLDDIDLNKTKGIKEFTFNIIKEKIIENFCLVELISEFQGLLSLNMVKKLYEKYPSIEKIRIEMRKNPYKCLCGISRVGFKTADNLLLEIDKVSKENISKGKPPIIDFGFDLKTSLQRCLACILFLLEENENNGHTKMNIVDLKNQCDKLIPACSHHFVEAVKDDSVYYNKNNRDVAIKSTYDTEEYIAKNILYGLEISKVWNIDCEKYRTVGDVSLTDEQLQSLKNVCEYNISILNGSGGCVDCDTEFFDGTQWKKISDYNEGDSVLQYNEDGTANLVKPIDYIKQSSNQLWHFKTKYGLDQCLSDNHTVVYSTSRGNIGKKLFSEVRERQNDKGFNGWFITSFLYDGVGINLNDDYIRLMVAVFADGNYYRNNEYNDTYLQVRMHLKKQRKKDRLELLLNNLNLDFRKVESATDGYHDYYFFTPFRDKNYPTEWYNCSKKQLKIIADEVMNWDGEYSTKNRYSTTNKLDADFVQWVFTSLGYRASISEFNRIGNEYITNNDTYIRKSKEYVISYTDRKLVSMCTDKRIEKTTIDSYTPIDGFEYCFTVPSHMLVLRRNDRIFITGNCGKSQTTANIINMLEDNNKTYRLFSPTGKAAKVLKDYCNRPTSTIHRGLGHRPPSTWGYNEECKLDCDVLIIDEFSMTDIFLFKHVIDALDFNRTKLVFVGDNAQLASVSCGNLLHDFMESKIIPTTTLTKVFRYGEGGLMKVATDVRECKTFLDKDSMEQCTYFGSNKDYAFINVSAGNMVKNVLALYQKLLLQGNKAEDILVLSAFNKGEFGTIVLNNYLQKLANPNFEKSVGIKFGETTYYKGDLVIQKQNNYKARLYIDDDFCFGEERDATMETFIANGETGVVLEVGMHNMIIDFDGVKVEYSRDNLQNVGLGYSISTHKSQGGNAKIIILLTPQAHTIMLNSNILYVGLTRMRERCFHFGNIDTVNKAIKKKENFNRMTFMKELLK